ncbi:MAG: BMP family ABC transporter substrate-binding protein [Chloroflexota bacterium]|nr:BMP family ABC transporter substrate-binding protein [Chloroflexota bacterium]
MKRLYGLLVLLLLATLMLAACGTEVPATEEEVVEPAAEEVAEEDDEAAIEPDDVATEDDTVVVEEEGVEDPFRVAFVYVAPVGDLGWSWSHDQGRLAIEDQFGDQVETAYVESVPEGPEATRVIRDFAQQGYDLIFTTSFGYMDQTIEVAQEFPDTQFVHISGFRTAPNVSTVFGRMYIPRYLSGLVAGAATESDIVGYVAAFPIPEVIRGINAFTLGVRAVNPEAEVRVVYTNTWFGPPEEREAAQALLDQGADVIAQHQDTTEPQKAAAEADAVSIGYNSDMREFVGDTVLTSPIWYWGVKYTEIVQQVMDGTYPGDESYWSADIVGLAPFSPMVDARIVDLVGEQDIAIREGQAEVFCGPITSNTGALVVEEGNCLTDEEMLSMYWYVEGVVAEATGEEVTGLGEPSELAPASSLVELP